MSRLQKINGYVRPNKPTRFNINKYIDEELAIYDMMLLNNMQLEEDIKPLFKNFIKYLKEPKWVKVKDYVYEYQDLEMLFHLEKEKHHKTKHARIESKFQAIEFQMNNKDELIGILIKFKNIPVWYPIQTYMNSPYVFDDDKEVVLINNEQQKTTVGNLISTYLEDFDFSKYEFNQSVNLKDTIKFDKFCNLITLLKQNSILSKPYVNIRIKTKYVNWITWETDNMEILRRAMRMKPTTKTFIEDVGTYFMFDRNDMILHKDDIFEKLAGKAFKNFTEDMHKANSVNKNDNKTITDNVLNKVGVMFGAKHNLQREVINYAVGLYFNKVNGAIINSQTGTGKSYMMIAISSFILSQKPTNKVLIIVPLIMVGGMKQEIEKFAPKWRKQIDVINYHKMEKIDKKSYDIVMIDEVHNLTNRQGKMFKFVRDWNVKFKLLFSGTPIQNKFEEYVALVELLYPNFGRIINFALGGGFKDSKNMKSIMNLTKGIYIQKALKDDEREYKVYKTIVEVDPTPTEIKMIGNMKRFFKEHNKRTEIKDNYYKNDVIVMLIRGLQIISNHKNLPEEYKIGLTPQEINQSTAKVKKVIELVKYHDKEKIIVFSRFKDTIKELHGLIPDSVVLDGSIKGEARTKLVNEFQHTNKYRVIIISLQAGNSAITLTSANVVIFETSHWQYKMIEQAMARAIRYGQTKDVYVYEIFAKNTIDDVVRKVQSNKQKLYDDFDNLGKTDAISSNEENELVELTTDFLSN